MITINHHHDDDKRGAYGWWGGEGGLPFYAAAINSSLRLLAAEHKPTLSLSLSLSWPADASNLVLILSKRKATSGQNVSYCDRWPVLAGL